MKKKKLLLVYPKDPVIGYVNIQKTDMLGKKGIFMCASLPTLAALTPSEFEITIIDENVEVINFDAPYNLVGITGVYYHLPRVRQIAAEFSKRNVLVVCGGPSVTLNPEKWRSFTDVLITGEAERTWPQFIKEYLSGIHKEEYRESERFDLSISPLPDYSGFSEYGRTQYFMGIVQTSRGCPFDCDFCGAHVYLGHKIRYKPVGNILREVEQLYRLGYRVVFLADDNFSAGRKKAREILIALRDWNQRQRQPVTFITQLSIDTAQDEELLELAAEAGLHRAFIGIESPNVESLKEVHKFHNAQSDMLEDLKKFHQHGIMVVGSTIVGFDHDDLSVFQQQFDFLMRSGVAEVYVHPLQAREGTRLKESMIKEGRYIDWEQRRESSLEKEPDRLREFENLTIIPQQMSLKQLRQGIYWLIWHLYKPENLTQRVQRMFEDFEASPKKHQLTIPRDYLDLQIFKSLLKVIKHLFFEETPAGRKAFWQMFRLTRQTSYPKRFAIVIFQYFMAKHIRTALLARYPQIDQLPYPEEGEL